VSLNILTALLNKLWGRKEHAWIKWLNVKAGDHLVDLGEDGTTMLKWIFKERFFPQ
jgi:hypothetical protein